MLINDNNLYDSIFERYNSFSSSIDTAAQIEFLKSSVEYSNSPQKIVKQFNTTLQDIFNIKNYIVNVDINNVKSNFNFLMTFMANTLNSVKNISISTPNVAKIKASSEKKIVPFVEDKSVKSLPYPLNAVVNSVERPVIFNTENKQTHFSVVNLEQKNSKFTENSFAYLQNSLKSKTNSSVNINNENILKKEKIIKTVTQNSIQNNNKNTASNSSIFTEQNSFNEENLSTVNKVTQSEIILPRSKTEEKTVSQKNNPLRANSNLKDEENTSSNALKDENSSNKKILKSPLHYANLAVNNNETPKKNEEKVTQVINSSEIIYNKQENNVQNLERSNENITKTQNVEITNQKHVINAQNLTEKNTALTQAETINLQNNFNSKEIINAQNLNEKNTALTQTETINLQNNFNSKEIINAQNLTEKNTVLTQTETIKMQNNFNSKEIINAKNIIQNANAFKSDEKTAFNEFKSLALHNQINNISKNAENHSITNLLNNNILSFNNVDLTQKFTSQNINLHKNQATENIVDLHPNMSEVVSNSPNYMPITDANIVFKLEKSSSNPQVIDDDEPNIVTTRKVIRQQTSTEDEQLNVAVNTSSRAKNPITITSPNEEISSSMLNGIVNKVYKQIENKLKNERQRRGLF